MTQGFTYQQTIEWLYNATPQFQRIGAAAYKPGIQTAITLSEAFGNPHRAYPSVHVAGTNGKGSTCHTLAAILQSQGYKVGLYTSPHLVDFRERIRINGEMIPKEKVVEFVDKYRQMNLGISPSFFELTTIMAFDWFATQKVDIAIIETGLGGRLDTTNIITPVVCAITNISKDHTAQLGNTLAEIASEKAGIIKPGVPVVVGNDSGDGVSDIFVRKSNECGSDLILAGKRLLTHRCNENDIEYSDAVFGNFHGELAGDCQPENTSTVLCIIEQLQKKGFVVTAEAVAKGFASVTSLTGLAGRWMKVSSHPDVICDTGHNAGGWEWLAPKLDSFGETLSMVIGFVGDKDISAIVDKLPKKARYFLTQPSVPRALPADSLKQKIIDTGIEATCYPTVCAAFAAAKKATPEEGTIFIGGSNFIVGDYLAGC